jgi:hypothetical protein
MLSALMEKMDRGDKRRGRDKTMLVKMKFNFIVCPAE